MLLLQTLFLLRSRSTSAITASPLAPWASPIVEQAQRGLPQRCGGARVESTHDHRAGACFALHEPGEPGDEARCVRPFSEMEGEDAIGARCVRRGRHQSSPCLAVSHDCERACGERRGSGQRLPGVRLGQNGEASMGDDPAQTLVHLLGSFAHGSDLRCWDRRSSPATLLLPTTPCYSPSPHPRPHKPRCRAGGISPTSAPCLALYRSAWPRSRARPA